MDSTGIFDALQRKFGKNVVFGYEPPKAEPLDDYFFVAPKHLVAVARHLRDEPALHFDFLECLSGVDYPDAPVAMPADSEATEKGTIHVVYHLRSYVKKQRVVIKVSLPRSNPKVASLCPVWSSANWQERECFDLFGVIFEGHPDLRRVLLPEDWTGHPLRKDYQQQESYHGIPTTRQSPLDLLTLAKPDAKPEQKKPADKKVETSSANSTEPNKGTQS